jgi:hypothetical protein
MRKETIMPNPQRRRTYTEYTRDGARLTTTYTGVKADQSETYRAFVGGTIFWVLAMCFTVGITGTVLAALPFVAIYLLIVVMAIVGSVKRARRK